MSSFKLAFHTDGRRIVEVYDGRDLIAVIYPTHLRSVRVISKHGLAALNEPGLPPAMSILIGEQRGGGDAKEDQDRGGSEAAGQKETEPDR